MYPSGDGSMTDRMSTALHFQTIYAGLVIVWQVSGYLLALVDLPSPGPNPSLPIAVIAFAFALAFRFSATRAPIVFALLSLVTGYAAASSVHNAFVADPALWPADAARYAGAAINVWGVGAALFSVFAVFANRKAGEAV